MKISILSIHPDIFTSFLATSLIARAQTNGLLEFEIINPRDFTTDRHQTVDDTLYGGGAGLLLKAQPLADAIAPILNANPDTSVIIPRPSDQVFNQDSAHFFATQKNLIFVCGRYEWIDARFERRLRDNFPNQIFPISLGQFVTMGGETPAMTMIEAITRLVPGVIKEEASRQNDSYSPDHALTNLEHPQFTKPETVLSHSVPEILLSGHHARIEDRKKSQTQFLDQKTTKIPEKKSAENPEKISQNSSDQISFPKNPEQNSQKNPEKNSQNSAENSWKKQEK